MSWSIGHDDRWKRDIGHGVPSICDHPGCGKEIDRGLAYVCGSEPQGGERGCGLYFCEEHLTYVDRERLRGAGQLCDRCYPRIRKPFVPTPDIQEWIDHKLTDESWADWRAENPDEVRQLESARKALTPAEKPAK